jgi:hypothetical protein
MILARPIAIVVARIILLIIRRIIIGEISNELITASLPAALTGYDAGELGPANAATSSCLSTGSSIPSADDIRIFRERLLHLVHTVIPPSLGGGKGAEAEALLSTLRGLSLRAKLFYQSYTSASSRAISTRACCSHLILPIR